MTAQITHVRFHGYRKHEDIAVYKWRLDTGETVALPASASDHRAMRNLLSQLRAKGVDLYELP